MNTKQLNEQLYAKRALVGTKAHCICEDCIFYAEQIMKNTPLIEFLHRKGLDPRKANEVWCYMEKDGCKYYTVDFFQVHADQEEKATFGNAKVTIYNSTCAEKETLPYVCTIDVVFTI